MRFVFKVSIVFGGWVSLYHAWCFSVFLQFGSSWLRWESEDPRQQCSVYYYCVNTNYYLTRLCSSSWLRQTVKKHSNWLFFNNWCLRVKLFNLSKRCFFVKKLLFFRFLFDRTIPIGKVVWTYKDLGLFCQISVRNANLFWWNRSESVNDHFLSESASVWIS